MRHLLLSVPRSRQTWTRSTPTEDLLDAIQNYLMAQKYARCDDKYSKLVKSWKNNRSHMFDIVLQHCPPDLVQRLKSKDLWAITKGRLDVIAITKMICDVAHAHDDTTQGTMAIVASDMTLYTT